MRLFLRLFAALLICVPILAEDDAQAYRDLAQEVVFFGYISRKPTGVLIISKVVVGDSRLEGSRVDKSVITQHGFKQMSEGKPGRLGYLVGRAEGSTQVGFQLTKQSRVKGSWSARAWLPNKSKSSKLAMHLWRDG